MASRRIKQLISGTTIGCVLLVNLLLFLPLTLFLGNEKEFSVPFNSILFSYIAPAITLLAILAIVSMLLPKKAFQILVALIGILSLLVWVQGNLFVWDYGLLNGSSIKWDENKIYGWFELVVWTAAISFVVWRVKQIGQVVVGLAFTLASLQLVQFGYYYWSSASELQQGIDLDQETAASGNIFRYSSTENIIHIIADGFQADILDEILTTGESGKQLSSALSGFTVFSEHLGAFPYTHMSVPAILSSNVYQNHMPIDDFMRSSLRDDSIITLAKEKGYEIDLAIPRGVLADLYENVVPDNIFPVNNGGQLMHDDIILNDAARLFDLSLFRAAPHYLKRHIYNDQKWLFQSLNRQFVPSAFQNFSHMAFLRESSEQMTADRESSVYKLFHLMLSHNPMVTSTDCQPTIQVLATVRENVITQARCGLWEIAVFLEKMKKTGIYDSSTIIVMGDHGAWVPPDSIKGIENSEEDTIELINPAITALATPFFAIKRPGDIGPIQYSNAPSSITDTAKTIASIKKFENDFDGTSVYELSSNVQRDRRFMFYRYQKSEWADNHLAPIEEFQITGEATDSATWTPINTYFPNGEVQPTTTKSGLWQTISSIDMLDGNDE